MTETEFAQRLGVSRLTVSEVLLEKRGLARDRGPARAAARHHADSWLRMQEALDLWKVNQNPEKLAAIQPIKAAA